MVGIVWRGVVCGCVSIIWCCVCVLWELRRSHVGVMVCGVG